MSSYIAAGPRVICISSHLVARPWTTLSGHRAGTTTHGVAPRGEQATCTGATRTGSSPTTRAEEPDAGRDLALSRTGDWWPVQQRARRGLPFRVIESAIPDLPSNGRPAAADLEGRANSWLRSEVVHP